jgi:hypothetical protein
MILNAALPYDQLNTTFSSDFIKKKIYEGIFYTLYEHVYTFITFIGRIRV